MENSVQILLVIFLHMQSLCCGSWLKFYTVRSQDLKSWHTTYTNEVCMLGQLCKFYAPQFPNLCNHNSNYLHVIMIRLHEIKSYIRMNCCSGMTPWALETPACHTVQPTACSQVETIHNI